MATTASGFWYPDEATSYNINTLLSTMASSIEAKVGPHVLDTGEVNINIDTSKFAYQGNASPTVRKVGKQVSARWGITNKSLSPNTTNTLVGTVPQAFRPSGRSVYGAAVSSNPNSFGRWYLNPDGSLYLSTGSSIGNYYLMDSMTWLVD